MLFFPPLELLALFEYLTSPVVQDGLEIIVHKLTAARRAVGSNWNVPTDPILCLCIWDRA